MNRILDKLIDTRTLMAENMQRVVMRELTLEELEEATEIVKESSRIFMIKTLPWYKRVCFCCCKK